MIQEINSNIKFMNIVNANNKATIGSLNKNRADIDEDSEKQFVPGLQIQDTAWKMLGKLKKRD